MDTKVDGLLLELPIWRVEALLRQSVAQHGYFDCVGCSHGAIDANLGLPGALFCICVEAAAVYAEPRVLAGDRLYWSRRNVLRHLAHRGIARVHERICEPLALLQRSSKVPTERVR